MAVTFSRSLRSLKADSFRPSMMSLVLAMTLILAWLAWFFFAPIPIYETSQVARFKDRGIVAVQFDEQALTQIQPGQPALLNLTAAGTNQSKTIPALVMRIPGSDQAGQVEVYALIDQFSTTSELSTGAIRSVEVEIGRVPLSTLVLRASGQLIDTTRVSQSPADLTRYNGNR